MVSKKLAMMIAAIGILQANMTNALGLGELSILTSLNQPLEAEIALQNTADLDDSQIVARLADPEDFNHAGISRNFFLTGVDFKVELDGQGSGVIRLTSRDPVVEPYLNFLIETRWPDGRLLREYTVLVDLPNYDQSVATASSDKQYRVSANDNLWRIALKSRPSEAVSVQQTMLAIQRLNPQAFEDNINHLKKGSLLRLPTQEDISVSETQALNEVANQNRSWRPVELSEPQLGVADASETSYSEQPRLSIVTNANSDDSIDVESLDSADSAALESELAASAENLDKAERDNQELLIRLDDMEARLAVLQRLLELKERQLADLQTRVDDEVAQARAEAAALSEQMVQVANPPSTAVPESVMEWVEWIWNNRFYVGGAGALLLVAITVLLLRREKHTDLASNKDTAEADNSTVEPEQYMTNDNIKQIDSTEESDQDTISLENAEPSEPVVSPAATAASDIGDVMAETEIYMAFGHYQQAIGLLRSALHQQPGRIDLQIKLLKAYLETRDKLEFQQQYRMLQSLGDAVAIDEVKTMLASAEGAADWLDGLPSHIDHSIDDTIDFDLDEFDDDLDLADLDDIDLFDLDAEMGDNNELPVPAAA
ncbi:FimV/HubP family polar landmark protein, partial [uncultured Oceanicoccus sp.]|uniref:type IV pilus assembly protein FimV n=1 Tax=uncultured Oceanicoccus sp. TaxID=1706381 RepID=UPI0030DAF98D